MEGCSTIRIVSANLSNGHADPHAFARLVEELDADVVAVQELDPAQARALAGVRAHGHLAPACDYQGMGIALRHPAGIRRVSLHHRDALVAQLDPSGWPSLEAPLEVLNVHIQAPHSWPWQRSFARRRAQLAALTQHLDDGQDRRRALVGDLNATPTWPVYRDLTRILSDAAVVHANGNGRRPAPTWGPLRRGPRMLRIDHVLVQHLRVEAFRVLPIRNSDHSAVVADLRVGDRVSATPYCSR